MSLKSHNLRKPRAEDNEVAPPSAPGILEVSRPRSFRTVVEDGAALVGATGSAYILHVFDPEHNQSPQISTNLRDQRINSLIDHGRPGISVRLDYLAEWTKQAQAQVMGKIASNKTVQNIIAQLSRRFEHWRIPQLLSDPPPLLFLAACLSFAFAVAAFRQSHRRDRYQDRIVGTGIGLGLAGALQTQNFLMESKSYMAWSTILALVFSAVVHRMLNLCSDVDIHESEKTKVAGHIR